MKRISTYNIIYHYYLYSQHYYQHVFRNGPICEIIQKCTLNILLLLLNVTYQKQRTRRRLRISGKHMRSSDEITTVKNSCELYHLYLLSIKITPQTAIMQYRIFNFTCRYLLRPIQANGVKISSLMTLRQLIFIRYLPGL